MRTTAARVSSARQRSGSFWSFTLTYDDEPEGHEPSGGMGSALLSKGLPLFFFGKQVHQLGGSPWNPQVAQRNFMALDPMRKAMFGFLVLRLLGLSPL